jgi:hypothetical protein
MGMATGMIPHGRVRAHGAQERYRCEERARWGPGAGAEPEIAELVLPNPICLQLGLIFYRGVRLMRITTALRITLISVLRGRDAARESRWHTEYRGDHAFNENLPEL